MLTCKKKIEKKREQNEQLSSNFFSFTLLALFAFMVNKYGDLPDDIYNQCLPDEN